MTMASSSLSRLYPETGGREQELVVDRREAEAEGGGDDDGGATSGSGNGNGHGNGSERREKVAAFPLTQMELAAVIVVFAGFGVAMLSIYLTMPDVDYQVLRLPHNVDELRLLTDYISGYANDYTVQVVLGYCVTYIFMQTFMIPGTVFFSLLAGALFGVSRGLILVICTATAGASSSFFFSKMVGRPIAYWLWRDRLLYFSSEVAKRENRLLNYMLFLRITPSLPNTFINVASPIVDVPFRTFFLATFFGLIPAAFVTVRAGLALNDLHSLTDLYDAKTLVTLFLIGLVSVLPAWAGRLGGSRETGDHLHRS